jgi:hypothetical protein
MSLTNLNTRNPTIKRIMKEMKEMQQLGSWQVTAAPLDDNLYEWHFTIRGPSDSAFDGGVYHGSILLPQDYPFKPPNIVLLTVTSTTHTGFPSFLSGLSVSFAAPVAHQGNCAPPSPTVASRSARRSVSPSRRTTPSPGNHRGVCALRSLP